MDEVPVPITWGQHDFLINSDLISVHKVCAYTTGKTSTVFTHQEATAVIGQMPAPYSLMAGLMYGAGLRISECLRLRIKDIDFGMQTIGSARARVLSAYVARLMADLHPFSP